MAAVWAVVSSAATWLSPRPNIQSETPHIPPDTDPAPDRTGPNEYRQTQHASFCAEPDEFSSLNSTTDRLVNYSTIPLQSSTSSPRQSQREVLVDHTGEPCPFPAHSSTLSLFHLIFLIPAWALQLFLCSVFAAWMLVQFALMGDQRAPKFSDALPVFVLILAAVLIISFIIAEIVLFSRRKLDGAWTLQGLQFAKLGASLFGWLGLFFAALLDDSKKEGTHVRWAEVLVGLGGVALLQIPWIITLGYACSVRLATMLSTKWEKNHVQDEEASSGAGHLNRSRWVSVIWPFCRSKSDAGAFVSSEETPLLHNIPS